MLHNAAVPASASLMQQPAPSTTEDPRRWTPPHLLGLHDTADPPPHEALRALSAAAASVCRCAAAQVELLEPSLHDTVPVAVPARHGLPASPLDTTALCRQALRHAMPDAPVFALHDLQADAPAAAAPLLAGTPSWRFYAAVPLWLDGAPIGALAVIDTQPRQLDAAQREALRQLAHAACGLLRERRRLQALHGERERLLDLARSSGDWMWETDAQLRHTWVSGRFEAITGMTAGQVRGKPLPDAPLLDDAGQPLASGETLHALLRRQQPIARVITAELTPNGLLQVSRSAVPVFDARGGFIGYRGTARDVSTHLAVERQTHVQAELLRKLSAQVPGVIFQFRLLPDRKVHYLYASDAVREMYDAEPPREGDGGDATAACRQLHPDEVPGFMPSLFDAAARMQPWHREYRVVRHGTVRWHEVRAVPEPHPEGGTLWHGFTADVTQRKEIELALRRSEERWGLAAEAAGIGIAQIVWPAGDLSLDARACAAHGLGHPHAPLTVGEWLRLMPALDRERVQSTLQHAVATGGAFDLRYAVQRSDGSLHTLEMSGRCTFDAHRRATGIVGTCRDVTQQVALEQLRAEKEAAERANRAKSEFLSRVSHELRTPLNGILGFAQLMALDRAQPLGPEQTSRLDHVLRAGRHLLDLINDVLNLARIEHQDFTLQRVPVDLAASVDAAYGLVQPQALATGVRLIAPRLEPAWVEADARAIEQVLLNLLSNAIKYNRPHGAVRIGVARHSDQVRVSISDEGEGFTREQQALLFQPFHRFGAEKRRVEGSGLGLVIARELAMAMQGELLVQSEPGACRRRRPCPRRQRPPSARAWSRPCRRRRRWPARRARCSTSKTSRSTCS